MTLCTSSLISAYAYDTDKWILSLTFRTTNETRSYAEFPPELFSDFEASESKGKFYNASIKGKFKAEIEGMPLVPTEAAVPSMPVVTAEEESALAEPKKKQPEIDALMAESAALIPASTTAIVITSSQHYAEVAENLKRKVNMREKMFNLLDPIRQVVYEAYSAVQKRQKNVLEPMDISISADKRALTTWDQEQQRLARERQAQLQREAEAAAAIEQQRRTEELRLAAAAEAMETGNTEAAELSLFDEAIVAPPVPVYVPRVEVQTPVVAGMSTRKNWKCEITSLEELILDVAEGIKSMRKDGKLAGHAPVNTLEANMPALNKLAKANEMTNLFPGVAAFNDGSLSVRKDK